MSAVVQIGDIGFESLMAKPATLSPPSILDLYMLWSAYKTITGASDWKIGAVGVIKGDGFRAVFKAFAKAVAAIDSLMDDPAKLTEVQQAATGLLS